MRILVVEDDADQRDLIRETLQDHFGPDTVATAECGHEVLARDLAVFDVILTDFNLPDITGMDFLKAILAKCDKPVIVVTGENVRQTAAQAIRAGAYDYIVKSGEYLFTMPLIVEKNVEAWKVKQENKRLHEQQQQAAREISIKNQQLKDSLQKLQQMAATDPLTGLYNRRHFSEVLERCFAESLRYNQDLACIMCDLDGYKKLNDTLGHQFGDKILQVTAKVITWNLRVMDIAARYGGDEFVLLLPHASAICHEGRRRAYPCPVHHADEVDRPAGAAADDLHGHRERPAQSPAEFRRACRPRRRSPLRRQTSWQEPDGGLLQGPHASRADPDWLSLRLLLHPPPRIIAGHSFGR